ncbi:MAG: isopenicillin N synthase family dioxygenase [Rhodanobacter sp.]
MRQVPTLDIRRYDTDRQAFVAELGVAYREFGFCCISGHGIPGELIDGAYAAFQQFFALPTATKMQYHIAGGGGARGYTPFKVETAKDSQYPDLKEFWHIGREIARDSTFADVMPANLWPAEVPDFRRCGYGLYQALDQLGTRMLRALALHIGQPDDFFDDKTNLGNSILRPIHYPPIVEESGDCQVSDPHVRAGAHEDINFITLLVGASAEGLEVLSKGEWLPITTAGDAIVVNIGDMLQRLSNHVYPSTTHRVVNPPNENARKPRYSIPFFLHPNPDVVLDPLESCVTEDNPRRYDSPVTAHEYLLQRLREIKLI